jgi:glycosyltransferase involved in cell wall biosynthesis
MKILMTTDAVGGVWSYAMQLCRALGAHEIEIVLATMGPPPTRAQRAAAEALTNVRLVSATWKLEWMADPWEDIERAGEWLLEWAEREHVELIHVNGYAHAALPWSRPVLVVAHSCVCSWWQAVHREPAPSEWHPYRHRVAAGLGAADVVVAPTQAFLAVIESLYGKIERTAVVHNACAAPVATAQERMAAIFACGRVWDEAKNLRLLDAAARGLPWKTYVAGDSISPDRRECVLRSVECLGRLSEPEVAGWLRRASIFAHPALYEPFGLAVLEAAHHGCALVLSDVPTLRELWEGAALFASPHDPDAFRALLERLIDAPQERAALSAAARRRAEDFSIDVMASAYRALYADLVRSRPSKERAVA